MTSPLDGVRVLELGRLMAAPFAAQVLGDLGADIVKIERPGTGDESRAYGDFYFRSLNRNKRSVVLDLKATEGKEALRTLIRGADVFLHNWAEDALEKLGFPETAVLALNPRIVHCAISGFGPHDPGRPALDMSAQMASGIAALTGDGVRCGVPVSDLAAGLYAAIGILARLKEGKGGRVSTSLLEASASLLTYQATRLFESGEAPRPLRNAHPSIVPYDAYPASDGRPVAIAVANDSAFRRLCEALDIPEDPRFLTNPDRVRNRGILEPLLAQAVRKLPAAELVRRLREAQVPCDERLGVPEVFRRYPGLREGDLLAPALCPRVPPRPPPGLGEHTAEILQEWRVSGRR